MHNIVKIHSLDDKVKEFDLSFDFSNSYKTKEEILKKEKENRKFLQKPFPKNPEIVEESEPEAILSDTKSLEHIPQGEVGYEDFSIIENAKKKAEEILSEANKKAAETLYLIEEIKKNAYNDGYCDGKKEGYEKGLETGEKEGKETAAAEVRKRYDQSIKELLIDIGNFMKEAEAEKNSMIDSCKNDIKEIVIDIAEKVINVSLRTSGEVILKMVEAATENLKKREWAKIYISKNEAELLVNSDINLVEALSRLSDNIRIIPMDDNEIGTCIVELPDQTIDASKETQLLAIKDILSNSKI